jgi:hypothetical protein
VPLDSRNARPVGHTGSVDVESADEFNSEYIVPTTVHIPSTLLAAADRRARALRISRNRLIVQALERELGAATEWSPRFLEGLRAVDADTADAVADLRDAVVAARRSKTSRRL